MVAERAKSALAVGNTGRDEDKDKGDSDGVGDDDDGKGRGARAQEYRIPVGCGSPEDCRRAVELYSEAARAGVIGAQYLLGKRLNVRRGHCQLSATNCTVIL